MSSLRVPPEAPLERATAMMVTTVKELFSWSNFDSKTQHTLWLAIENDH